MRNDLEHPAGGSPPGATPCRASSPAPPPPKTLPLLQNKPRVARNESRHASPRRRPGAGRQPTVLARPRPGHLDALLALAGGRPQLAAVAVGEPVGAAHLAQGLPLAAGAHALPPHARAAEGAHRAAAGLCGDTGEKSRLIPCLRGGRAPPVSSLGFGEGPCAQPRSARLGGFHGGSERCFQRSVALF